MLREKEKPKTFLSRFVNGVVLILTRRERERESLGDSSFGDDLVFCQI